ncbi:MAG: DNA repair protein RadC [Eubacteriales bacterium]|nr:DNA repair protein RadC [Eubacteriales bacterium]
MNSTIKELPDLERPYEKCLLFGAGYLSDAELLAVILRTGARGVSSVDLARKILKKTGADGSLLGLPKMGIDELCRIPGIGKVKAVQIKCIVELSRRIAKATAGEGHTFEDAQAIASYYMEDFRHCHQEQVLLLMFNTKCRLLHEEIISKGTVNRSSVSPREIFLAALEHHAVYIILLHNHPSGDPTPSREDIAFTQEVAAAGFMLGIELMDHIVLGDQRYVSLREEGILGQHT